MLLIAVTHTSTAVLQLLLLLIAVTHTSTAILQLLRALEFFHSRGLNYHTMDSSSVLIWTLNPVSVKLSDYGFTHGPESCEVGLCSIP